MSEISVYVLTVAGVTILMALLELILPSGGLHAFTKGIMSIIIVFVIASPLPKLLKNGFSFDFEEGVANQSVLETVENQQISQTKQILENGLAQMGYKNVNLLLDASFENGILKIKTIFVDMSNLVLTDKNQHIINNEAVENFLLKQTGLTEGQVVFYD